MRQKIRAKKGSSLVIVVCVSVFLMAFALAMVYSSGLLLARANRRLEQERSYRLAQSFAQTLDAELKKYEQPGILGGTGMGVAPVGSFYDYAYKFLEGTYGEFDPDHPDETIFHYTAASPAGTDKDKYGAIKVILYKEANQEQDVDMSGEISPQDVDTVLDKRIIRYIFTVEVTANLNGVSYSYSTEYRQMAAYKVDFTYQGTPVYWDGSQWHKGSQSGEEFNPDASSNIQYEYRSDSNNITACIFENAYEEAGANEGGDANEEP